jgi:hypothetical protein
VITSSRSEWVQRLKIRAMSGAPAYFRAASITTNSNPAMRSWTTLIGGSTFGGFEPARAC